ncbi:transcription factor grauzone-like [Anopheles nili]|uniref:transcription factor grauzone-like n=1 Tax=Anopheles nili TaxID=185578 RepID=UPI00237A1D48|nr:transcription factor grauzone-like [Anopheles nili]
MEKLPENCRLCLLRFPRGRRVAIVDEEFQQKLKIVFPFAILPEQSLPTEACRGCSVTVDNFFIYSEKVRYNQESLRTTKLPNGTRCDLPVLNKEESFEGSLAFKNIDGSHHKKSAISSDNTFEENIHVEVIEVEPILDAPLGDSVKILLQDGLDPSVGDLTTIESSNELCDNSVNTHEDESDAYFDEQITDKQSLQHQDLLEEKKKKQAEDDRKLREYFHLGCEICSYMSETVPDLFQHYRHQHKINGYVRCCNRKFYRRARLLEHLGGHVGSISCEICGKIYKSTFYLELHKIDRHGEAGTKPFKCDTCHLSFHKPYLLKTHQKRHEPVRCNVCDKQLMGSQGLKAHMQKMHGKDTSLICPTCGKEFRCQTAMDRHLNAHMGIVTIEKVQCDKCERWFDGKYNLRRHIRYIHDEEGQIICDICQHVSPNRRALNHHKQRVHSHTETYDCEFCGKQRNTKLGLREHMATHTKIPLYSCEFCGLTFNSNANKYSHRKSKHPEKWKAQKQRKLLEKMGKASTPTLAVDRRH